MNLGCKISELRKQKGWSQSELAKRMADAFEVSLDYLVGSTEQKVDKTTLTRRKEINRLPEGNKKLVNAFLDSFITKTKLQGVL